MERHRPSSQAVPHLLLREHSLAQLPTRSHTRTRTATKDEGYRHEASQPPQVAVTVAQNSVGLGVGCKARAPDSPEQTAFYRYYIYYDIL